MSEDTGNMGTLKMASNKQSKKLVDESAYESWNDIEIWCELKDLVKTDHACGTAT